MYCEQI